MAQFLKAKFLSQALEWKSRFPNTQFYGGMRFEPFIYEQARKSFPSYSKLYPDNKEFTEKFVKDLRNKDAALLKIINPDQFSPELDTANIQFETEARLEQQVVAQTNPQEVTQPFSLSSPSVPRVSFPAGLPPTEEKSTMVSQTEQAQKPKFQVPKIPQGISSFGQNLGSSTQIGLKKSLGRVGGGLGSIFGSVARGGGGVLVKAGGFSADALARASNQISRGGLITGPSKRVWIGAVLGFLVLFFILGGISDLPTSTPTGETAPIPPGVAAQAATSQLNCSTSMTAQGINDFFESRVGGSPYLAGTGQVFVDAAQKYKINPALIIAIGIQESNLGVDYAGKPAENTRNAFGLMEKDSLIRFNSWTEGVEVAFRSVSSYKCTTFECIGQRYAPIGAANDPTNLNKNWVSGVNDNLKSIPQSGCGPAFAGGGPADLPSGWPAAGTIAQGPYGGFSHNKLNAIDIANPANVQVYSTLNGVVSEVVTEDPTPSAGYGVHVIITNEQTKAEVLLGHLVAASNSHLTKGQKINKGDPVGIMDETGYSKGNHVHYEIRGSIKDEPFGQFVPGGIITNDTIIKRAGSPISEP